MGEGVATPMGVKIFHARLLGTALHHLRDPL